MIKLVCPECRRENEPERIYCRDCGTRLDRSALAKVVPKGENAKETQRRLRSMLDPQRGRMRRMFFKVSKLILGALALAALIVMVLPPLDVPARVKSDEFPPQINLDLENAATSRAAAPLRYTETQVNLYLGGALKSKQAALSNVLTFERALVNFDSGVCRVTAERSLFGYSFFTATSSKVALENGKVVASNIGGSIGRMPIHPVLMKYGDIIFSDLWTALDREKKAVAKMGAIEFQPQTVILTAKQ